MKQQTEKPGSAQKLGSRAVKSANEPAAVEDALAIHHSKKLEVTVLALFSIISAALLIFLGPAHQSLAKIYVGSIPVKASETASQIQQKVEAAAANYKIQLGYTGGKQKDFTLAKAGLSVDSTASAANAADSIGSSWLQRLRWWQPIKLPLQVKSNEVIFRSFIARYATRSNKPPKNAGLAISNGKVTITPPKAGKGYVVVNAYNAILDSVVYLSPTRHRLEPAALRPSIQPADLASAKAKVEKILSRQVVLSIAGRSITPTPSDVGKWLDLNPAPSAKTVDVSVNSGKVLEYINSVAGPYIKPPRNRLLITKDSVTKVLDPGSDGSDVLNKDKAAADIAKQLLAGKAINIELPISYAKVKSINVKEYPKWLIVDVTNKRMYAYEKDKLVKTFLVSAGAPLTPTVEGQFSIFRKVRVQDMRGANADGSRYFQPSVPYVNYFFQDYAIHGNYWRPLSYFGNVNSSHGCIGVVDADASWIYNWAPVGTPVIVHS